MGVVVGLLPDYWLERPPLRPDAATHPLLEALASCLETESAEHVLDVDELLRDRGDRGDLTTWELLCGLTGRRTIAYHGTGDSGITSFEPRQPIDFAPFGDQKAVFATSDPIWAMFYAIVDRDLYTITLNNGCIELLGPDGRPGTPYYYFSVSRDALPRQPWRTGYLYFLPPQSFVGQPPGTYAGQSARVPQLASPVAVAPLARLRVAPGDFPFLAHIRGHDDARLSEYATAIMAAAPWPE